MKPDTLRKMIADGPVEVKLHNGDKHILQSSETTLVSDFEIVTLMRNERGLYAGMISIDAISTAVPARESV